MNKPTQVTRMGENQFMVVQLDFRNEWMPFPSYMSVSGLEGWLYTRGIFDSDPSGWHKVRALETGETAQVNLVY